MTTSAKIPDRIGPFRIRDVLGYGGMGAVYLAEQSEPIKREVALKVLRDGLESPRALARFEVEREAMALMAHPNIAHVLDAGVTDAGRAWVAIEYVRGLPITEYCAEEGLDLEARLGLMIDVCAAVAHAHQKGIIHRDIKPSNVMITVVDGKPVVKVIDFGLARRVAGSALTGSDRTEGGMLIGTPAYMSPEQAAGKPEDVDTRTDVYGLGVLLYELVTGEVPHGAPASEQVPFFEVLDQVLREDPLPPSARISTHDESTLSQLLGRSIDAAALRRRLDGDLDRVILKALEKERDQRYASAGDLAADLGRYLAHEPVLAASPSAIYRLRKFVRRHRLPVAAAAAVFVALAAGLLSTWMLYGEAERARDTAETALASERDARAAEASARADEAQARAAAESSEQEARAQLTEAERARASADAALAFLLESFESVQPGRHGVNARAIDVVTYASVRLADLTAADPVQRAALHHVLGATYRRLGRPADAQNHLDAALALRREHLGDAHVDTVATRIERARGGVLGVGERAARARSSLQDLANDPALPPNLRRSALQGVAEALETEESSDEAASAWQALVFFDQDILSSRDPGRIPALLGLARALLAQGEIEAGRARTMEALEIGSRYTRSNDPRRYDAVHAAAEAELAPGGNAGRALRYARFALLSRQRVMGSEHPATAASRSLLERALRAVGRTDDADAVSVGGHQVATRGDVAMQFAQTLLENGDLDRGLGICDEVLDEIREALAESPSPKNRRGLAYSLLWIAERIGPKARSRATPYWEEGVEVYAALLESGDGEARDRLALGWGLRLLALTKDARERFPLLERALRVLEAVEEKAPEYAQARFHVAVVQRDLVPPLLDLGRRAEAAEAGKRAIEATEQLRDLYGDADRNVLVHEARAWRAYGKALAARVSRADALARAVELFDRAYEDAVTPRVEKEIASLLYEAADAAVAASRLDVGRALTERALAAFENADLAQLANPSYLEATLVLTELLGKEGELEAVLSRVERVLPPSALEGVDRLPATEKWEIVALRLLARRAMALRELGREAESTRAYADVLSLSERFVARNPDSAYPYVNAAAIRAEWMRAHKSTSTSHDVVLDMARQTLEYTGAARRRGADDALLGTTEFEALLYTCDLHRVAGRIDEARRTVDRLIEVRERIARTSPGHGAHLLTYVLAMLAAMERQQGHPERALETLEQALDVMRRQAETDARAVWQVLNLLSEKARVQAHDLQRLDDAAETSREQVRYLLAMAPKTVPGSARNTVLDVAVSALDGRVDESDLDAVFALVDRLFLAEGVTVDPLYRGRALFARAMRVQRTGAFEVAVEILNRAIEAYEMAEAHGKASDPWMFGQHARGQRAFLLMRSGALEDASAAAEAAAAKADAFARQTGTTGHRTNALRYILDMIMRTCDPRLGDFSAGTRIAERALALLGEPTPHEGGLERGQRIKVHRLLSVSAGRLDESERELRHARQAVALLEGRDDLRPNVRRDVMIRLANALDRVGKTEEAREVITSLVTPETTDPYLLVHLGNLLRSTGRPGDALAMFERCRAAASEAGMDPEFYVSDDMLAAHQREADASERWDEHVAGGWTPEDAADAAALGRVAEVRQDHARAVVLFERAFELSPPLAENLDLAYRFEAAAAALQAAAADPTNAPHLRERALAWLQADLILREKDLEDSVETTDVTTLDYWHECRELRPIRAPEYVDALPEAERKAIDALWRAHAELLRRARLALATAPSGA